MDFYDVLGVRRDANPSEIKQAFRKQALLYHPDMHSKSSKEAQKIAAARFREASNAYEVLSNASSRAHYDRQRSSRNMGGYQSNPRQNQRYGSSEYSAGSTRRREWGNDPFNEWARYQNARAKYQNTMRWKDFSTRFGRYLAIQTFASSLILLFAVSVGTVTNTAWEYNNRGKRFEDIMNARLNESRRDK